MTKSSRILFVFTSTSVVPVKDSTSGEKVQKDPTGWYLPEAAHPYYVLSPHFNIDFAAPAGPNPPMDPQSHEQFKDDDDSRRFLDDSEVQSLLKNAKRLGAVNPDQYIAIYYIGGRGPVYDLPKNEANIQLANEFYRSGKLISAVCHGPAALVRVSGKDGKSIFNGKEVTAFSDAEEAAIGTVNTLPFSIEEVVRLLGADYKKADNLWEPKVVCSGKLITGQNPASARPLAKEILKTLKSESGSA